MNSIVCVYAFTANTQFGTGQKKFHVWKIKLLKENKFDGLSVCSLFVLSVIFVTAHEMSKTKQLNQKLVWIEN